MTALKYAFFVFSKKKVIIFWCLFIVYTLINGLIQGIALIIELSFFTSTALKYQIQGLCP